MSAGDEASWKEVEEFDEDDLEDKEDKEENEEVTEKKNKGDSEDNEDVHVWNHVKKQNSYVCFSYTGGLHI